MSRHIEVRRLTLFAVAVALLVSGCGGSTAAIIGEWQVTNADLIFEFFQDNTVTLAQAGRTFTGQYNYIDNENIRLEGCQAIWGRASLYPRWQGAAIDAGDRWIGPGFAAPGFIESIRSALSRMGSTVGTFG